MTTCISPELEQILSQPRLPELGPGHADQQMKSELEASFQKAIFGSGEIKNQELGRACVGGLWLHFDFLDESHQISQQIEMPEGSYWHGVMHRREGDFANASYWFRRAGGMPFLTPLGKAAGQLFGRELTDPSLARLASGDAWDPYRFVDICKACIKNNPGIDSICRKLQRLEWTYLFSFCLVSAFGKPWSFDPSAPGPFQL